MCESTEICCFLGRRSEMSFNRTDSCFTCSAVSITASANEGLTRDCVYCPDEPQLKWFIFKPTEIRWDMLMFWEQKPEKTGRLKLIIEWEVFSKKNIHPFSSTKPNFQTHKTPDSSQTISPVLKINQTFRSYTHDLDIWTQQIIL